MRKLSLFSFFAISLILLSGCGNSPTPLIEQETNTGETIQPNITTGTGIQTSLDEDALQALDKEFGTGLTLSDTYQLGNYFITLADDNSGQPGSIILIVMGKINNSWLSLYEGNSGEISCTIITQFGFPQELLDAFETECLQGADYTIPERTIKLNSIIIQNQISDSTKNELNTLYNRKMDFKEVQAVGDFIIAKVEEQKKDYTDGYRIVVAKINGQWTKIEEGNASGPSCSISQYGFPKELLTNCI